MADSKNTSCAVICEYNPFHYGHLWQLNELHREFETVVCVLGGNVTQRGVPAVSDRYLRAEAALRCGADLVVELPLPWCCASAGDFARGGISVASRLGVQTLAFSAESDERILREAARRMEESEREDPPGSSPARLPYPKHMEEYAGIPLKNRPNDILGLEYLRHADGMDTRILRRNTSFAPSVFIRNSGDPLELIPSAAAEVFRKDPSFPRDPARSDTFLLAALQNGVPETVYAVPDELRAALLRALPDVRSVRELTEKVKGKMFTVARVQRALWAAVFRIDPEAVRSDPPYTLLLSANELGRAFLKRAKPSLPVVSRPASLKDDPVFRLNLRANRVLRTVYGYTDEDDLKKKPVFQTGPNEFEG
ncbi:MAG: nucleotidyltransferase family protein [Clostridia bacterium]|nr:nucleotidyltransferase family protein [Clostridia bacterium]